MGALPAYVGVLPAFAQEGAEIEIADINASRYSDGGRTQAIIELRGFSEAPDPAQMTVTANGEPVSDLEVAPLSESAVAAGAVLAIDTSGSMAGAPLEAAKAAAKGFVAQARPGDRIALITFSDEVRVLSGFTGAAEALNSLIDGVEADGDTAFNDAVIKGVGMYADPASRDLLPHMIVLTDGDDTGLGAPLDDAVAVVKSSDVRVFGVVLESPDLNPDPVKAVAEAGDGLFLSTPDAEGLSALYEEVGREISNTMVARFTSPVSTPGDVEFAVAYQGLSAATSASVSGYATTTTTGPAVTTTLGPHTTVVIERGAPLDTETLILVGTIGLGLTVFLIAVILFGRDEEGETGGRFARRLQAYGRRVKTTAQERKSLLQRIPLVSRFTEAAEEEVRKRGLLSGVNSALEQANVPMSPGEAILAMLGFAAVGGLSIAFFNGLLAGLIAFGVMLLFLIGFVRFAGGRERRKFEDQLPDTLTLLSTSLRAGYSLLQAAEAVTAESPDPTAREFGRATAEARLGMAVQDSFDGIAERTRSRDFEWAVMAIDIQREVGGNLAEVLQTVADTMRARNRLRGEIRALTAEGRISAIVLASLPFALFAFLWFANREYLLPLLESMFGRIAIAAGILLMAGGVFWLKKIVDIEI